MKNHDFGELVKTVEELATELNLLRGLSYVLYDSMENGASEWHVDRVIAARGIYEMLDRLDNKMESIVNEGYEKLRDEKCLKAS